MVTIGSLWIAILISGVLVWIASALVWVVLPHHKSDFRSLPDEEAARQALLPQDLSPGLYNIPHVASPEEVKKSKELKSAVREKFEKGPVAFITILPKGMPNMGKNMGISFVFYLVISVFVAYLASRSLAPDATYLTVFRLTGTVAWMAYGLAIVPDAIWFGRPWGAVAKNLLDALLYALLTAGVFGWLWPN